jgi:3-oxoadipate enol-lactonase
MPLTRLSPRLSFELHGDAGPRVLLVMGFGMGGHLWRPQVEGLRETHRLLTFDHAGIGQSEAPEGLPTMATMARGALRLLDEVGWRDAHVVGVSMGGMISQELALLAPERVRTLTLIATHAGGPGAVIPPLPGLALFLRSNTTGPTGRVAALKRLLYTPEFLAEVDVEALDRRMHDMLGRRASRRVIGGHLHAVLRHDTRSRLARIQAPTLIIRPGRDVLVHPRNSDVLARHIPRARLLRFDHAGHGITFQCAADLNREIAQHVRQSDPAGRAEP